LREPLIPRARPLLQDIAHLGIFPFGFSVHHREGKREKRGGEREKRNQHTHRYRAALPESRVQKPEPSMTGKGPSTSGRGQEQRIMTLRLLISHPSSTTSP
jgi:hypothetical protein